MLHRKGGIYGFINKINGKQYIGSARDLYLRLNEHLNNRKSNRALQSAISKYSLRDFEFYVYEYFSYINKPSSNKLLTDLESIYIKRFKFEDLYNFIEDATSLSGYKHTEEAKIKMARRYKDKTNHPFYGKHHDEKAKLLISKPGKLNPMYGKTHTEQTKHLMRTKKRKYIEGVGIYDLNNNLVKSFDYASDLAKYLNISKPTVSKYLSKGLLYKDMYYFKVNVPK
jgi:group I intron endonuclease